MSQGLFIRQWPFRQRRGGCPVSGTTWILAGSLASCLVLGCGPNDAEEAHEQDVSPTDSADEVSPTDSAGEAHQASLKGAERDAPTHGSLANRPSTVAPNPEEWPLVGRVSGVQLRIHRRPQTNAPIEGVLRLGAYIRMKAKRHRTPTCATGWMAVYPKGYACAGQGIETLSAGVENLEVSRSNRVSDLPYDYFKVKQARTAEYFRPPTDEEWRRTWAYARRLGELEDEQSPRLSSFLRGELKSEPIRPGVVSRFLDRGFHVAITKGAEQRGAFIRTIRGGYIWKERLVPRSNSTFQGVELKGERTLPMAWMRRTARPRHQRRRADGTMRWAEHPNWEPIPRQTVLDNWLGRERSDGRTVHRLEGDRFLLAWFVGVSERVPERIFRRYNFGSEELWVHVDRSEQTLVAYRGATPLFSTLVSTGVDGHETPLGMFRVQKKRITATMSNLGPEAGDDRYRIEDVPWTQYFEGSLALHGAFWHERFGLRQSHGCINLSPADARRLFDLTQPEVPSGWHGVNTRDDGTRILISE
ncbi:MAG: L,D-transpeptidase [Myxococcota bacterium]